MGILRLFTIILNLLPQFSWISLLRKIKYTSKKTKVQLPLLGNTRRSFFLLGTCSIPSCAVFYVTKAKPESPAAFRFCFEREKKGKYICVQYIKGRAPTRPGTPSACRLPALLIRRCIPFHRAQSQMEPSCRPYSRGKAARGVMRRAEGDHQTLRIWCTSTLALFSSSSPRRASCAKPWHITRTMSSV